MYSTYLHSCGEFIFGKYFYFNVFDLLLNIILICKKPKMIEATQQCLCFGSTETTIFTSTFKLIFFMGGGNRQSNDVSHRPSIGNWQASKYCIEGLLELARNRFLNGFCVYGLIKHSFIHFRLALA